MSLSHEEKALVQQALQVYIQIAAQQMPQQHIKQLMTVADNVLRKIDNLQSSKSGPGGKPAGITDEWYNHVCKSCNKLSATGCTDKVTEKYPGKCDPILHYEREKLLSKKK